MKGQGQINILLNLEILMCKTTKPNFEGEQIAKITMKLIKL